MRVKVTQVDCTGGYLEVGEIYDVFKNDIGITYILDSVNDKLYFDLLTGRSSWFEPTLDGRAFTFEEVLDKPKYATSPEALAQVLRKMADNVEKGLRPKEGIQMAGTSEFLDIKNNSLDLSPSIPYRVKPETITLKNGIEVPKPLPLNSLKCYHKHREVYFPAAMKTRYNCIDVSDALEEYAEEALFYLTEDEAIKASKALFGLEIKE